MPKVLSAQKGARRRALSAQRPDANSAFRAKACAPRHLGRGATMLLGKPQPPRHLGRGAPLAPPG
eukprot:7756400-Pyramimonas_sp.AAC.1